MEWLASKAAGVAAGEECDAGGRALGHDVVVFKLRAPGSEPVEVGGVDLAGVVVSDVRPTLIVGYDDQHVGAIRRKDVRGECERKQGGQPE